MADRTSAGIFAFMFELLAENPSDSNKALALKLYNFYQAEDYDFNPSEMYVSESCLKLQIAKLRKDKNDKTDRGMVVFLGEVGFDQA